MSTDIVYYPHAVVAYDAVPAEIFSLSQISDVEPGHNFQDLTEFIPSLSSPQFTGTHQAAPDNRFTVTQIKSVLDACISGNLSIARDLSAGNVDVEYKAGSNLNVRLAGSAVRARMQENAMLTWESITCRQGQIAEIRCRLAAIYKSSTGNDPLVFTAGLSVAATAGVVALFTQGPVKLNGSFVPGVTDWMLENNIEYEEEASDGDGFITYLGIKRFRPVLTLHTRDASVLATYGTRGTALSAFAAYLRKKLQSNINVADATEENIQIGKSGGAVGTIKARKISSPTAVAEVTVQLAYNGQEALYAIDTTAAVV